jgi:hypothetical protein
MSGPRITSGVKSKQDYRTPDNLMAAVTARYGPISFDLAAHAGNTQSSRYFAPKEFTETLVSGECTTAEIVTIGEALVTKGASNADASSFVMRAIEDNTKNHRLGREVKIEYTIQNSDPKAEGFDAFAWPWHKIGGLLWLNCEFNDTPTWAKRCAEEAEQGAEILLLTPSSTGSNWARDLVFPKAGVDFLNGRLCFSDEPFPKDCMLSHFTSKGLKQVSIWDWKRNIVHNVWDMSFSRR